MIVRRKNFSYARSAMIGTVAGAGMGAVTNLYRNRNKKGRKVKAALSGGAVGATIGAGIGIGAKYGSIKYKNWIGPVKKATPVDVTRLKPGDIIKVDRGFGINHYGVVVDGKGNIVEYGAKKVDPRLSRVRKVSISEFQGNSAASKVVTEAPTGKYSREEIVRRAEEAVGKPNGSYNLRTNNCEHFARDIANGEKVSTQVDNAIGSASEIIRSKVRGKFFSGHIEGKALNFISKQGKHLLTNTDSVFKARKYLSKELGGLSHFNQHQTKYLAGGGSILGGTVGSMKSKRKAKKDAINKYGLKKGTLEYDNYIKSRTQDGFIKGTAIGGVLGAGLSKGVDTARGKVIADKLRAGHGFDPGKNYITFGKNMRGIKSEKQVQGIIDNWSEIGDFAKASIKAI